MPDFTVTIANQIVSLTQRADALTQRADALAADLNTLRAALGEPATVPPPPTRSVECCADSVTLTRRADGCYEGTCPDCDALLTILPAKAKG